MTIPLELKLMAARLRELFPEAHGINLSVDYGTPGTADCAFHGVESYETGTKMLQRAGASAQTKEIGGERRVILEGEAGGVDFAVFVHEKAELKRGAA